MNHVHIPTPGFYFYQKLLGRKPNGRPLLGPPEPVAIAKTVTPDPHYPDNIQDRSPVWRAIHNGYEVDFTTVWPWCAGNPITIDEYNELSGERNEPTRKSHL